jgi:signal transduction histidine kinase
VIRWPFGRDRRFMIRSYLILAGGLMIVAVVLDFAFTQLQTRSLETIDPWVNSTFSLIENSLAKSSPADRSFAAREIARQIGVGVEVLEIGDISAPLAAGQQVQVLLGDNNDRFYLKTSPALKTSIRLGPIGEPTDDRFSRFLPVLFYLSILVVVGLWLRPLLADMRLLTAASQKFAADYREPLTTARDTTQLTSLARNLDDMSSRLSHLIQSQKELTAALSHEMRTPLARIRFALAVIGNQASEPIQKQLHDINNDVHQIDGLIASMLDYARLDHPDLRMDWQETALEPWFRHALAASESPAREVQLLGLEKLQTAWLEPRLMELALSNLVVNACRYARRRVNVSIATSDKGYTLCVEDDGEGIPTAERGNVFKAYTRLDTSRNRDTGGFGLGLAIVARVADLHGGRATALASEALGGAKFTISWQPPMRTVN